MVIEFDASLLVSAVSIEAALHNAKNAALRADKRGRSAMQAGETFLTHHKAMERAMRKKS